MTPGTDRCRLRVPLVGIGASDGGIEALQTLLAGLPPDLDLAYVVSVDQSSVQGCDLPLILRQHTQMLVEDLSAGRRVVVEAGHVYVITPDSQLEITDTRIGTSLFARPCEQRAPIDNLFRSLAARQKGGFAVVLSGDGSDGVVGARAIREAGGLVLIQDPREAMHDGMLHAVASAGVANVVLPACELATHLAELSRQERVPASQSGSQPGESGASREELRLINEELQAINHKLQINLDEVSRANHELENLVSATGVAALFLDHKLCVGRFTPQLTDIFDIHPSDRGLPVGDFTRMVEYETLEDDARQVLAELVPREREVGSCDGRHYIVRLIPCRAADDRIAGVVITLIDVSRLKQTEEALRESERRLQAELRESEKRAAMLQARNESRDESLSVLGHELRSPLAAIENSVALVNATVSTGKDQEIVYETTRRTLAVVARQSRHMSRLVDDLLDMARVRQGDLTLHREPADVNACMEYVMKDIGPEMQQRGVALEHALADGPIYIDGDRDRLTQIFENLLRNAMNYTNPGGKVRVASWCDDDHATFSVRDTGIGISPQDKALLFEPYYRGSQAQRGDGMGLGLTLCERLVLLHDGTIEVSSDGVGCGSEFTVTFPLGDSPAASETTAEPVPAKRRCRILVVDDDEDMADTFAALLGRIGHDAEAVYDGFAALEIAQTRRPEVVFVDLSMPIIDGIDFARRLKEHFGAEAPAMVALSGYTEDRLAADAGLFHRHLLKPVSVACVAELLERLSHQAQS